MSLPVAILAGGLATRLRPITEHIPKVLVEVAGKPFAVHQIDMLRRQGLTEIVFCVGHLGEQVAAALAAMQALGRAPALWLRRAKAAGHGRQALRQALPLFSRSFFVMYGDAYLTCDFGSSGAGIPGGRQGLA